MHALTINDVSFRYTPSVPTLQHVSFDVMPGEFLSIVGPNGSGKSTLLRLLDRIYVPHSGKIALDGQSLASYTRAELARRIAFVPQDSGIMFPFTVEELVLMGRAPHTMGRAFESMHDREVAVAMMSLLDIAHLANQSVTTLSDGERQRVLIARALAQEARILLLDEPNAHLDIAHQIDVFAILKKLNKEKGLTIVSVSHDLNLASAFSNRIAMLMCGSIAAIGTPAEVLTEARIKNVFRTDVLVDTHPDEETLRITLRTIH
ncbi:MAG: ABC transporter ATP-binding protein [Bacteroidota bacterium]